MQARAGCILTSQPTLNFGFAISAQSVKSGSFVERQPAGIGNLAFRLAIKVESGFILFAIKGGIPLTKHVSSIRGWLGAKEKPRKRETQEEENCKLQIGE